MKILLLSQYLQLGGLERMVVALAQGLAQQNIDCVVAVYEGEVVNDALRANLADAQVPFFSWQKNGGFCLRTVARLKRIVGQENITIIHTHDLGALLYGVCVVLLTGFRIKLVHTQHSFVHFNKGIARYVVYEKIFTRFAKRVCVVAEPLRQAYVSLGLAERKLELVPNGVQFAARWMTSQDARERIIFTHAGFSRQLLQTHQKHRWLISLGRIASGKGVDRILHLWSALPEELKSRWSLMIVGPQDETYARAVIDPIVNRLGASAERVVFTGATSEPLGWYFAADAFLSLSEQEGMPLAVYEAVGSGLPCLLSAIDGHEPLRPFAHMVNAVDGYAFAETSRQVASFLAESQHSESERLQSWLDKSAFRRSHGTIAMSDRYRQVYRVAAQRLFHFAMAFAILFSARVAVANQMTQRMTSVVERPEYLLAEDWQSEFSFALSRTEKAILILDNAKYCGPLPILSDSLRQSGIKLKWFRAIEMSIREPSYEGAQPGRYVDPLVPVSDEGISCDVVSQRQRLSQWLIGELEISSSAPMKTLRGEVISRMQPTTLTGDENSSSARGMTKQRWPISIRVLPLDLSGPWRLPLYSEFTPYFASLAHYGASDQREGQLTQLYASAMVEHRVLPLKAWIKHPFKNPSERESDSFLLSRFPIPELSFGKTVLSVLPSWAAVDLPRIDSSDETERLDYWRRWQRFLDEESEISSEAEMQLRMRQKSFVYLWDEPVQEDFKRLLETAQSVSFGAPSVLPLVTVFPWESLQEHIAIFVPLLQTLEREGKPFLHFGKQLWSYVSCMSHGCGSDISSGEPDFVIERNASYIRIWPWMARHFDLSAVLYYSVNNIWRKSPRVDPWDSVWDFTGNGDGTLFYPGRPGLFGLKEHQPIASLRLKFWRQASFDAEYIFAVAEKSPACLEDVRALFQPVRSASAWIRDSRKFSAVRNSVIECLYPTRPRSSSSLRVPL